MDILFILSHLKKQIYFTYKLSRLIQDVPWNILNKKQKTNKIKQQTNKQKKKIEK